MFDASEFIAACQAEAAVLGTAGDEHPADQLDGRVRCYLIRDIAQILLDGSRAQAFAAAERLERVAADTLNCLT